MNNLANIISLKNIASDEWLSMSNGATDIFIDILEQVNNHLTPDIRDNNLILWIIENHRKRMGEGFSGFDLGELPWDRNDFERERKNVISIISQMKNKTFWSFLDYKPNSEILLRCVNEFLNLLEKMTAEDIIAET